MGYIKNISFDKFPKQGTWLGKKVKVYYHYDTTKSHDGVIVRDDNENPGQTIIHIPSENRFVLATEVQYS